MKVALRVDASQLIGSGHVMRCRTLASELRRRGAEVLFVCRDHPGNLLSLLQSDEYTVNTLPVAPISRLGPEKKVAYADWLGVMQTLDAQQTIDALHDFAPDWLIVDHYGLDAEWELLLRPQVKQILVIDDLANRAHACDVLLDQNWFGDQTAQRYRERVAPECHALLGPRFALLHPAFWECRKHLPVRSGVIRSVLLFFGGVDSRNQTSCALRALCAPSLSNLTVDVVVGAGNRALQEIESLVAIRPFTTLHRNLPNLADLMVRADLMLGAGGTTTWERCSLGLPAIVVFAAENQRGFTEMLAAAGVQYCLGNADQVTAENWQELIERLRTDPLAMLRMGQKALKLTDGCGVFRVVDRMQHISPRLSLRRVVESDEELLLHWANDPVVRNYAFSKHRIDSQTHHAWFHRKLTDSDCLTLIAEDQYGLPLGQVRFDCHGGEAWVDISVDGSVRGFGAGKELLRLALIELQHDGRCKTVVAEVLIENRASQHLFQRAGFQLARAVSGKNGSLRFVLSIN